MTFDIRLDKMQKQIPFVDTLMQVNESKVLIIFILRKTAFKFFIFVEKFTNLIPIYYEKNKSLSFFILHTNI